MNKLVWGPRMMLDSILIAVKPCIEAYAVTTNNYIAIIVIGHLLAFFSLMKLFL